jgi:hypothetical protein
MRPAYTEYVGTYDTEVAPYPNAKRSASQRPSEVSDLPRYMYIRSPRAVASSDVATRVLLPAGSRSGFSSTTSSE